MPRLPGSGRSVEPARRLALSAMGARLTELRAGKGLTRQRAAAALGVTDTTIANWEEGRKDPRAEHVVEICQYFQVSADWLLGMKE